MSLYEVVVEEWRLPEYFATNCEFMIKCYIQLHVELLL